MFGVGGVLQGKSNRPGEREGKREAHAARPEEKISRNKDNLPTDNDNGLSFSSGSEQRWVRNGFGVYLGGLHPLLEVLPSTSGSLYW